MHTSPAVSGAIPNSNLQARPATTRIWILSVFLRNLCRARGPVQGPAGAEAAWTQNTDEVAIGVPVDNDVTAKDISCEIHVKRIRLAIRGQLAYEGAFDPSCKVDPDGSFFTLESKNENSMCIVTLAKKEMGHDSWEALFDGEAKDDSVTQAVCTPTRHN